MSCEQALLPNWTTQTHPFVCANVTGINRSRNRYTLSRCPLGQQHRHGADTRGELSFRKVQQEYATVHLESTDWKSKPLFASLTQGVCELVRVHMYVCVCSRARACAFVWARMRVC